MARQRHTPKGRLLITGTVLLILLVAGILIAGRTINGVAVQMSGRIVRHISEYHYRLLQVEFERSEGVLDASVQFMRERTAPTDAELHVLAATLMRMDPKAGCVWFAEAGGRTIRSYPRGKTPRTTEAAGDFRQRLIAATDGDSVRSHVTGSGRIQVWSMACPVTDRTGRRHICGIDFPLPEIYTCMTQSPASSGYATLFDPEGVIVYHPTASNWAVRRATRRDWRHSGRSQPPDRASPFMRSRTISTSTRSASTTPFSWADAAGWRASASRGWSSSRRSTIFISTRFSPP